jgi:hypothetical protein
MTTRRGFLGAMLAAAVAPAFVHGGILMPVRQAIAMPSYVLWGDGLHDDTAALQAAIRGESVVMADGSVYSGILVRGVYRISQTLVIGTGQGLSAISSHFDGSRIADGGAVIQYASEGDVTGVLDGCYFKPPERRATAPFALDLPSTRFAVRYP